MLEFFLRQMKHRPACLLSLGLHTQPELGIEPRIQSLEDQTCHFWNNARVPCQPILESRDICGAIFGFHVASVIGIASTVPRLLSHSLFKLFLLSIRAIFLIIDNGCRFL